LSHAGADATSLRVGVGAAEVFLAVALLTLWGDTAAWLLKGLMVGAMAAQLRVGEGVALPAAVLGVLCVLTTVRRVLRTALRAATKTE